MEKSKIDSGKKTPIEQMFSEIAKREMTAAERRVLLAKRKKHQKSK